jgi:hypothetical protein
MKIWKGSVVAECRYHFPGGTEENHKEPRSLWTMSRLNTSLERYCYTWLPGHSMVMFRVLNSTWWIQPTDDEMITAEGWCDAVRGTAGCRWICWTTVGRSDVLFYEYTQTENIKHFEQCVVSECTGAHTFRMCSRTLRSLRNLAHAHLLDSWQGSCPGVRTVLVQQQFAVVLGHTFKQSIF